MKLLSLRVWSELDAAERTRIMERSTHTIFDPGLMAAIGRIYDDVKARGDQAVIDATRVLDKVEIDALLVPEAEIAAAHATLDPALLDAIRVGIRQVRAFNEAQVAAAPAWRKEISPGVVVGEEHRPIPSVGLFVPCGKGSFPSVLVMIGVPAVVAGVPEITVIVPPLPGTTRGGPRGPGHGVRAGHHARAARERAGRRGGGGAGHRRAWRGSPRSSALARRR